MTQPDADNSTPGFTENAPRDCGACNVCCTAMHVRPLGKPAGERCPHESPTGCGIYHDRPDVCRDWYCMWVRDPKKIFNETHRPDRLGIFFTARLDPLTSRPTLYAHPIRPGALDEPEAADTLKRLRQYAPVEILPTRDVTSAPVATLTIDGREVA